MSVTIPDPLTTKWLPFGAPSGPQVTGTPSVRVFRSTAQACPASAWTSFSFDTVRWDTNGHWSASNPTRLTCQVAGKYIVTGHMRNQGAATTSGSIIFHLLVNGVTEIARQDAFPLINGQNYELSVASEWNFAVGDYVELRLYNATGVSFNLDTVQAYSNELTMALIGGTKGDPGIGVPTPVVNGQWIKGVGGAAVWSAIAAADLPRTISAPAYQPGNATDYGGGWSGARMVNDGIHVMISGLALATANFSATTYLFPSLPPPGDGKPHLFNLATSQGILRWDLQPSGILYYNGSMNPFPSGSWISLEGLSYAIV